MRALDLFNHYLPPAYYDAVVKLGGSAHMLKRAMGIRSMSDIDYRVEMMKEFEGYCQVPCVVSPPIEALVPKGKSAALARMANEAFCDILQKYPEQFPGFAANLPMDDLDAAVKEAEYAMKNLGAAGVQIFTNMDGRAMDTPELLDFYREMEKLGAVVWMHPARTVREPYYKDETLEPYELWWTMMWPIETSMAAARLVYAGLFVKCPGLKFVIHHAGGMIPMLEGRLENGLQLYGTRTPAEAKHLTDTPVTGNQADEFRKFYADTATFGSQAALECALHFYGYEHMVFASDMPFDPEKGPGYIRRTLRDIEGLEIPREQKDAILFGNACRLIGLQ